MFIYQSLVQDSSNPIAKALELRQSCNMLPKHHGYAMTEVSMNSTSLCETN